MEHNFQTKGYLDSKRILEGQLRESFGRVVYSHKTHEKCADILLSRLAIIKLWQIAFSVITTGGFLGVIFGAIFEVDQISTVVGVLASILLLALNTYMKDYDLGELAQKHRQSATELWLVREKYLSLLTDLAIEQEPLAKLQKQRDDLLEELHSIYVGSPSTTFKAYRKAQKALKKYEDMTFSEQEIDAFLPVELKRG